MTSAPSHASVSVHEVPASNCVKSMTRTPASAGACVPLPCSTPRFLRQPDIDKLRRRYPEGRGYRSPHQESLTLIAAEHAQQGKLRGGLDAFGGDAEAQGPGERDHAAN